MRSDPCAPCGKLLLAKQASRKTNQPKREHEEEDADDSVSELIGTGGSTGNDIELALARAEHLVSRRPLLLNSVLLRQNPSNVGDWHSRVDLLLSTPLPVGGVVKAIECLGKAVKAVEPQRAVNGNSASLWIRLAKIYEEHGEDKEDAREVYRNATGTGAGGGGGTTDSAAAKFKNTDDLAQCFCHWAEMELRFECYPEALAVVRSAVSPGSGAQQIAGQQAAGGNKGKGGKVSDAMVAKRAVEPTMNDENTRIRDEESTPAK